MPDVSSQFMPELKEYALPNIKPAQDVLLPRYGGYSLSNIPATVCKLLNIPEFGESSLASSLYEYLGGPYKRVILLVVDALGYNLLNHLMATDKANFWRNNLKNGVLMPLTSICPSTTVRLAYRYGSTTACLRSAAMRRALAGARRTSPCS